MDVYSNKDCVNEKLRLVFLNRYGNSVYFYTDDFKKKSDDKKIEKYNNVNYNNPNKNKETCLKRYGVEYPIQYELFRIKSEKTKEFKYNNKNFVNPEKTKKTCLIKYGVDNSLKNNYISDKAKKTRLRNRIEKLKKYNIEYDDIAGEFVCKKGHHFLIDNDLLSNRIRYGTEICIICNPISSYTNSGYEIQLQDFIINNWKKEILFNNRRIINVELDIYIPELKLAFEFNGLYWHNELNKSKNYHLEKTELCEKEGIQLIHIYEDDWIYKQNIVKSMILNKLNKTPNKIYARKCKVKEIYDNKLVREFLEKNHIQGFIGSSTKIGLFYNNELVSLMTFGKRRVAMGKKSTDEGEYELLRFCSKLNTNVIGGANKLFKYFINSYNPVSIVTYADRSWSQGNLYEKLGFKYIKKTKPNYFYIINKKRIHRFNFRKSKLVKDGYDANKTEYDIMSSRNIHRIYNSGNLLFMYKKINIE